jgi:hypothetical protein
MMVLSGHRGKTSFAKGGGSEHSQRNYISYYPPLPLSLANGVFPDINREGLDAR